MAPFIGNNGHQTLKMGLPVQCLLLRGTYDLGVVKAKITPNNLSYFREHRIRLSAKDVLCPVGI